MKIISKIITVSIIGITASALAPMVFADTTNPWTKYLFIR